MAARTTLSSIVARHELLTLVESFVRKPPGIASEEDPRGRVYDSAVSALALERLNWDLLRSVEASLADREATAANPRVWTQLIWLRYRIEDRN